jgi:hypothetical protein
VTTRSDFTDEEWARLEEAPIHASAAILLADRGGPIGYLQESLATIKTLMESAQPGGRGELVDAVAKSLAENPQRRRAKFEFKRRRVRPEKQSLAELEAVNALLEEKATREEAAAFREWLLTVARRTAEAAKEGGLLGLGAERVSEGEQRMLERLGKVLSASGAGRRQA